ncbi:Alg9-like mannosyltransferase family-domain-containing protein [Syncephalis pseudoplumigaleata]|uniref:Mannosyltransferase n=1 Tax=Syncephalis pseudoplumigaleata TaxID=1712513 RepID=A0A4P9Z5E1_9FUNG|nr:Alg9-like mannosyltransferase family-domain-containing protein [Syncephalis pseudoplumigaleata]|eukprot:RKP27837.1 Alg9-like mannosyltransferase family-domain-containing protein [Syncephalis pseudoplumigaleata]
MPRNKKQQQQQRGVRPETATKPPAVPAREEKVEQEEAGDTDERVYCPTRHIAFRLLCLVRIYTAAKATIPDCDEVYNYWEPTHYLQYGSGLQTWEYSPVYAIRSWAYIGLHALLGRAMTLLARNKVQVFYAMRFALVVACAACETAFYQSVVDHVNRRVARYLLVALLFSAGMAQAAPALLPSTFAMYTGMLAASYFMRTPAVAARAGSRTLGAVLCLAAGAAWGWPFSGAIGLPFALEELLVRGMAIAIILVMLWRDMASDTALIALLRFPMQVPLVCIDRLFYRRWVVVPWNIVRYNVLGGEGRGPDLYGTEPWWFYLANGLVNFNVLWPLALGSIPLLIVHALVDGRPSSAHSTQTTSATTMLAIRLAPVYLWLGIFTCQAHKEERFLYPIYPLVCFNASVALHVIRQLVKRPLMVHGQHVLVSMLGLLHDPSLILSGLRIYGLHAYYHAPMSIYSYLANVELAAPASIEAHRPARVCVGKEWFRFPSSYFLPTHARLHFLRSHFHGLLPKYFIESAASSETTDQARGWRPGTWTIPTGMNDMNREEPDRYVSKRIDVEQCDYLVDVDFPHRYASSSSPSDEDPQEPRYHLHPAWRAIRCEPYLDAAHSRQLSRLMWLPRSLLAGASGDDGRAWGRYCLLARASKEAAPTDQPSRDNHAPDATSFEHSEL